MNERKSHLGIEYAMLTPALARESREEMKYLIDTKDEDETRTNIAELLKPLVDELDVIDVTQPDARVRIAMVRRQLMRLGGIE